MRSTIALSLVVCLLTTTSLRAQQQEEEGGDNSLEQSSEESTEQTTQDTSDSTTEPTNQMGETTQEMVDATSTRQDDDPDPQPTPTPANDDDEERQRLLVGGLAVLVVVLAVVAVIAWTRPPSTASRHDAKALAWLEENRTQLRIDLALGEGPTIDDLAAVYRVPAERRAVFAEALRTRRAELLDLAAASDARGFLRRVGEIMQADARLEEDFVRWRMVVGATEGQSTIR